MTDDRKSPEEWEAEDHITALKMDLAAPPEPCAPECRAHGRLEESRKRHLAVDIWVVRRLDVVLKAVRNGRADVPKPKGEKGGGAELDIRPGRIRLLGLSPKALERVIVYSMAGWGFGRLQGWW